MPSGAKRRKAAKKRRVKGTKINSSTYSNSNSPTNSRHGSDDLKSQDEKGSDGGEVSSSTTNDPDYHHHSCNEGSEEVEQRVPSAAQPSVADINSMKERKEGSVVKIERELKPEESSASNNVSLEYIEFAEESHYGSKKSGGTSNEESLSEKNSEAEPCKSIQGATTSEYLVKSADTAPAKITSITQNTQLKKADNSVVGSSVNSVKAVTSVSEENVRTSSLEVPNPKEFASKAPKSSSGIPFTESTNEEHNKDSRAPECSENQPLVAPAPRLVQKTSWLSCCGLFEVLSGSNR